MMVEKLRAGTSAKEAAVAERQAEMRRRAFAEFLASRRLTPAEVARLAGLPNANSIYNLLNGHSASMAQATLERIARALNVSVAEIIGERKSVGKQASVLPVRVEAASGDWRDDA